VHVKGLPLALVLETLNGVMPNDGDTGDRTHSPDAHRKGAACGHRSSPSGELAAWAMSTSIGAQKPPLNAAGSRHMPRAAQNV
jgi:hypothetical protein